MEPLNILASMELPSCKGTMCRDTHHKGPAFALFHSATRKHSDHKARVSRVSETTAKGSQLLHDAFRHQLGNRNTTHLAQGVAASCKLLAPHVQAHYRCELGVHAEAVSAAYAKHEQQATIQDCVPKRMLGEMSRSEVLGSPDIRA